MARVYTTRQLLDPTNVGSLEQMMTNRLNFDVANRAKTYDAIRKAISTGGSMAQTGYDQYKREQEISENDWNVSPDVLNDPNYRAAREEYIRTGNTNPMTSYMLQRESLKAKQEEAAKAAAKAERDQKWHEAVRVAAARPEYQKIQKQMLDAVDTGDFEMANIYKSQLQKYETEFGNVFGDSADTILDARKKAQAVAAEKKAQEKADQEEMEMGENNLKAIQEINENERLHKVALFKNSLPTTFAKEADKQAVYDLIEQNENMTIPEKTALHEEIRKIESGSTQKKKSIQSAAASKAGEATGKSIDEANLKNEASKYIGKKLNSLQWEDIPEDVRKLLKMDSKGNVGWK